MKKILAAFFMTVSIAGTAFAAAPLTSCPNGMTQTVFDTVVLRSGNSCNNGEGIFDSNIPKCTSGSTTNCWLYAEAADTTTDGKGTFYYQDGGVNFCPYSP